MPTHVVQRVMELLNDDGLAVSQSSILVVGVAYKPDVSDVRESHAYDVIGLLDEWNAEISYHDPHVPQFDVEGREYESVPLSNDRLRKADCVLLLTDHSTIDFEQIVECSSLVFDTRNATEEIDSEIVHQL